MLGGSCWNLVVGLDFEPVGYYWVIGVHVTLYPFLPWRCPTLLSAFRDRGVPGPTSEMSTCAPAQMGRRETEREGGGGKASGARARWKSHSLRVCPAPRSGALAVGGYKPPRGRGASGLTRAPVPSSSPRGQPSVRGPWSFLL
jgi:hypothetical protein